MQHEHLQNVALGSTIGNELVPAAVVGRPVHADFSPSCDCRADHSQARLTWFRGATTRFAHVSRAMAVDAAHAGGSDDANAPGPLCWLLVTQVDGGHMIPITLLVCDDDEDDRRLTKEALEHAHIANTVKFVADGTQLLDYLHQRGAYAGEIGLAPRPGLILIDIDMPTLDGREALTIIRSDPSLCTIPIVMLTPPRHVNDIGQTPEPGATVFMEKPVTLTGLLEALQTLGRYWLDIVEPPPTRR